MTVSLEWVESRSIPEPNTGCWLWLGAVSSARKEKHGRYARAKMGGVVYNVSRLCYSAAKGPVGKAEKVRHRCDNPYCVNPDHLLLGTQRDNMLDMYARGRHRRSKALPPEAVK